MSKATDKMITEAIGEETDEDPYATDGDSDFEDGIGKTKRKKRVQLEEDQDMGSETKREAKRETKGETKGEKKRESKVSKKEKTDLKNEEKRKLAEFVKEEDIIFNIQNKLHSNALAVSAAWERVLKKMNKTGNNFIFFVNIFTN